MRRIDFKSGLDMAEDFYAALEFSPGKNAEVDVVSASAEPYSVVATSDLDDVAARLAAAEARAEKAEGEVAYLRELRDWSRECARRARAADRPGKERAYMEWLELHSPPIPPPGVEP